jgi:diketogulonate reductase-like aldo/keto reductase
MKNEKLEICYGTYYFLFDKIYDNDFQLIMAWKNVEKDNKIALLMENMIIYSIKQGCRIFDTAKWYKNEHVLGKAIKKSDKNKIVERSDITLITKLDFFSL